MRLFTAAKVGRRLAIATAIVATACINPNDPDPLIHLKVQDIVVTSGAGQTGVEGQPLALPITAHTLMSDGSLDTTHTIYCEILSGGGSIEVDGATASGDGAELPGPGDGTISVSWTLGPAGQSQKIRLYVNSSETIQADITATSTPAT